MKTKYKNSVRSEKLIMDAVIHLFIVKKDLNLISITDICKYTGLNRGTFYNHYNNIMDVIDDIENTIVIDIWNLWPVKAESSKKLDIYLGELGKYIRANEASLRVVGDNIPVYIIQSLKEKMIRKVEEYCVRAGALTYIDKTYIRFIINGLTISVLDYLRKESDIDLDRILQDAGTLIKSLIKYENPQK